MNKNTETSKETPRRTRKKIKISVKNLILSAVVLGLVIGVILLSGVGILYAAPGSAGDPVISKSYVEKTLKPEIHEYVKQLFASSGKSAAFTVVSVYAGETFTGSEGTEFILRQGSGTIIGSANGGVADVTRGYDLSTGEDVPHNCLLIVPKAEGRGFKATTDVVIMVKGAYEVKK